MKKYFKKNAFSSILVFTFLGYLKPALGIFLLPIYLNHIVPEDYGVLGLVAVFTSIAMILGNVSISSAMRTFYFDHCDNENELKNYLRQVFSVNLFMVITFCSLLLLIGPYLYEWAFVSEKVMFYPYGLISIVNASIASCTGIYLVYVKNKVRLKEFAFLTIISVITSVIVQYYLIVIMAMGIMGILIGSLTSTILVFLIVIIRNSHLITFKINFKFLKPSFLFVLKLLPFLLLLSIERQMDKVFIERFMTMEDVGLYVLLMSLIGLTGILFTAVDNAIRPFLYHSLKSDTEDDKVAINSFLSLYIVIGLLAVSGVVMVGNNLGLLTDHEKYLEIRPYFVYAGISLIPVLFVRFYSLIYVYYKKSGSLTIITFFKTILLMIMLSYFIPVYGILGAILSMFIAEFINQFIFGQQVKSFGAPSLNFAQIFIKVGIFILITASFYFTPFHNHGIISIVQFVILGIVYIKLDWNLFKSIANHGIR